MGQRPYWHRSHHVGWPLGRKVRFKALEPVTTESALIQSFRSALTMIWEYREHTKHGEARSRSQAAVGLLRPDLDLDHIVPFTVAAKIIFADECDRNRFEAIVRGWLRTCLITKDEH